MKTPTHTYTHEGIGLVYYLVTQNKYMPWCNVEFWDKHTGKWRRSYAHPTIECMDKIIYKEALV